MSWKFTKGLHDIGAGHYAYLQPDGHWGYSNAGLVVDGDQSLLVDTLFDERLTAEMLGSDAREMLFVALENFIRARAPGRV